MIEIKKKKGLWIAIAAILMVAAIAIGLFFANDFRVEITPKGDAEQILEYGESYNEQGAEALLRGKFILKKGKPLEVSSEGEVDALKLGSYTVTYFAEKAFWSASAERKVTIRDTKKPSIELKGAAEVSITKGSKYQDAGFTAADNYDGDLTDQVAVDSKVDTDKAGSYVITYTVKDSSGNTAKAERKVIVKKPVYFAPSAAVPETGTVNPGSRTVYLTFDDGPSPYTAKLLNILKKYDAKATFFVTNNAPSYNYLMKRIVDEGHAIAIHSATHNYRKIYAGEEAFFDDLYKMQEIIYNETGVKTMLTRFPGGSSNTVSLFNPGIMSRLAVAVTEKGFRYFDWNVSSGDAGETTSTQQVARNVIGGISRTGASVVLQHDIKGYSVDAVEQILQWGKSNGYTFKALDMTSPTARHGINN